MALPVGKQKSQEDYLQDSNKGYSVTNSDSKMSLLYLRTDSLHSMSSEDKRQWNFKALDHLPDTIGVENTQRITASTLSKATSAFRVLSNLGGSFVKTGMWDETKKMELQHSIMSLQKECEKLCILLGENKVLDFGKFIDATTLTVKDPIIVNKILSLLNKSLIENIVLNFKQPINSKRNKRILKTLIKPEILKPLLYKYEQAIKDKKLNKEVIQIENEILFLFKNLLDQELHQFEMSRSNNLIKKYIPIEARYLSEKEIAAAIRSIYLEIELKGYMVKRTKTLFEIQNATQSSFSKSIDDILIRIGDGFSKSNIKEPTIEWLRACEGGSLSLLKGGEEIYPAFNKSLYSDKEELNEALDLWIKGFFKKISELLFNNENLFDKYFEATIEHSIKNSPETKEKIKNININQPISPELQQHQLIFKHLFKILSNESESQTFYKYIQKFLNNNSISTKFAPKIVLKYIMIFYRALDQTYIWGIMGAVQNATKLAFPDFNKTSKTQEQEEKEGFYMPAIIDENSPTYKINIHIQDGEILFEYLKPSCLANDECVLMQQTQVHVPIPGVNLDNKVESTILYNFPYSFEEYPKVQSQIEKFKIALQAYSTNLELNKEEASFEEFPNIKNL